MNGWVERDGPWIYPSAGNDAIGSGLEAGAVIVVRGDETLREDQRVHLAGGG